MEQTYDRVAASYGGFTCRDCPENCCNQRFFHHTYAEYFFLREGVTKADPELRERIFRRARMVVDAYPREAEMGELLSLMCPINEEGGCTLYAHRPMICRLHGMPHRFVRPDGKLITGGGCSPFIKLHGEEVPRGGESVDRTPFYNELALIERALRAERGLTSRYRKTTAEMLLDIAAELEAAEDALEREGRE